MKLIKGFILCIISLFLCSTLFADAFRGLRREIQKESKIDQKVAQDVINKDENLPVIKSPTEGQSVTCPFTIDGTSFLGTEAVEIKLGSGQWILATGTTYWKVDISSLSVGPQQVRVRALYQKQDTKEVVRNFIVAPNDTNAPTISGPANNQASSTSFTVTLTANKNFGYWSTNGSQWNSFLSGTINILIDHTVILRYYGKNAFNFTSSTQTFKMSIIALPEMVYIPAVTSFSMGRPNWETGNAWEQPVHAVNIDAFFLGKYEVTIGQYCAFLNSGGNDNHYHGAGKMDDPSTCGIISNSPGHYSILSGRTNYPIVFATWYDASNYCVWISQQKGQTWRLPTEAEWEYAAVGNQGHHSYTWGTTWQQTYCNWGDPVGSIDGYQWSAPVGSYASGISPFGAYDMTGNVWEWCSDWYSSTYYSISPVNNPQGPVTGTHKVIRGGSWENNSTDIRCSYRNNAIWLPEDIYPSFGFRVVKSIPVTLPTGLKASDGVYSDKVALSWSPVANADSYEIYRSTSPVNGYNQIAVGIIGTNYSDTSAVPGTNYYYAVSVVSGIYGESARSVYDRGFVFNILTGLIDYYPFNGNANDLIGSHNGLVTNAALSTNRFGNPNSAYYFKGTNSFINLGTYFNYQTYSISLWVKNSKTNTGDFMDVIDNNHNGARSWTLQASPNSSLFVFGTSGSAPDISINLPVDQWAHIILIRTPQQESVYVNNVLMGSVACTGLINYDGTQKLSLGRWGGSGTRFFVGKVDDVRIYNSALEPAQVDHLYSLPNE